MSRAFPVSVTTTPLPTPTDLQSEFPLPERDQRLVRTHRSAITSILNRNSQKFLLVVGPCSIHDTTSALAYATHLRELQKKVDDSLLLVMRVHVEKPRTTVGWKGLLYDPDLDGTQDMAEGLRQTRSLLLKLTALDLPLATEFLDPFASYYLSDCISWGQIGARTSASQIHRQVVSGLSLPVGFKNTTQGDLTPAVNAVLASAIGQSYFGITPEGRIAQVKSEGNPDCHLVLRGSENGENFQPAAVARATQLLRQAELQPRLLIDCSHDNCRKEHSRQPSVFSHVLDQRLAGNEAICGAIVESHMAEGSQIHTEGQKDLDPNVSITDPCLGWEATERIILDAHARLEFSALPRG